MRSHFSYFPSCYSLFVIHCTSCSHSKRRQKIVFKTDYHLMQVKSIAEYFKGSILQYFRPSLSYHWPLRPLFCLFLSGRLRQVLLYGKCSKIFNTHLLPKDLVIRSRVHRILAGIANGEDLDQTASSRAIWYWSALFQRPFLSGN